jgi:putative tricarboxylic transport membrane protein
MAKFDKIASLIWFFFGLFIAIKASNIGIGSLPDPGPGFIFFLGGIFISCLSLIVFILAYGRKIQVDKKSISWEGIRWRKIIALNISLVIFVYLFEKIGYILTILFLMLYLFKGIEPQKWHIAIISAILTTLFVYLIFVSWLQCQLPKGFLPF